jgi:hypothetical protein
MIAQLSEADAGVIAAVVVGVIGPLIALLVQNGKLRSKNDGDHAETTVTLAHLLANQETMLTDQKEIKENVGNTWRVVHKLNEVATDHSERIRYLEQNKGA